MIRKLELRNFRNHKNMMLENFSENLNIIAGKNGEGKTNILEAMYMLTTGKSFRTSHDRPLINENESWAYAGLVYSVKINHKIEMLLENGDRKSIKIDDINIQKMSELFQCVPAVVFSPEDIKIIKEGPSYRRKFIDLEICRIRPTYIDTLKTYRNIIAHKNRALKMANAENLIDIYNDQLVDYYAIILKNREKYLAKSAETANMLLSDMGKDIVISAYQRTDILEGDIRKNILRRFEAAKKRELADRTCLFGPQRIDIIIEMNGRDTREFASQGEAGTLAMALKFAAAEIIYGNTDLKPVMFLDDAFSCLDAQRRKWVIEKCRGIQSFLTIASDSPVKIENSCSMFLNNGKIYT